MEAQTLAAYAQRVPTEVVLPAHPIHLHVVRHTPVGLRVLCTKAAQVVTERSLRRKARLDLNSERWQRDGGAAKEAPRAVAKYRTAVCVGGGGGGGLV